MMYSRVLGSIPQEDLDIEEGLAKGTVYTAAAPADLRVIQRMLETTYKGALTA